MSALITEELVALDRGFGPDRTDVIRHLAQNVVDAGRATQFDGLYADAVAREEKTATGVPGGIAIPHCRSTAVTEATLAMARLDPPVDFGAKDGPADLVFFIAAPEGADQEHLKLLSKLARSLIKKDFTTALREAVSAQQIVELVEGALSDKPAESKAEEPKQQAAPASEASEPAPEPTSGPSAAPTSASTTAEPAAGGAKRLVAVTACPTGIAHTYMAADSLVAAGERAGVDVQVETQGSAGAKALDPDVIDAADAVIFAVDVDVRDKHRFAGKPVVSAPVKRGIDEPDEMVSEAIAAAGNPSARRVSATDSSAGSEAADSGEGVGAALKRSLLTGVSYMIPFVAAGGLLMALGFLFGGYDIALPNDDGVTRADAILTGNTLANLPEGGLGLYLGAVLFKIGSLSMGFLIPALGGYIAYALADRPGIAPGFTAGAVAGFMGAGFLGGIVGGLLAGYVAMLIGRLDVPRWLRGLMPVVIIPLVASLVASGLMLMVLGGPIAAMTDGLNAWLSGMTGAAAIVLGIILGLMMAIDLGGPINKVAYAFAVAGLAAGSVNNHAPWEIMATVMAAGMVPPLAMALASVMDKKSFTPVERENGKAAWLLGAAFITEGAIPFAAADPFRVIPAGMVGAATTGALVMATGVTSQAPHGGIFVFFAIENVVMFVVAILAGMIVSALTVIGLKRFTSRKAETAPAGRQPATAGV